jgi:hypothetical protein
LEELLRVSIEHGNKLRLEQKPTSSKVACKDSLYNKLPNNKKKGTFDNLESAYFPVFAGQLHSWNGGEQFFSNLSACDCLNDSN